MFNLFRRNCLYNTSIDPHCAYCAHCKPENEYQGVCEFRGIVAMAGSCRRFAYDALRRKPPKPARIRGRFTADDFFFEEKETDGDAQRLTMPDKPAPAPQKPLISDDLSQFADLWEDDDAQEAATGAPEPPEASGAQPDEAPDGTPDDAAPEQSDKQEENGDETV